MGASAGVALGQGAEAHRREHPGHDLRRRADRPPNTWFGRWSLVYPELDGSPMPSRRRRRSWRPELAVKPTRSTSRRKTRKSSTRCCSRTGTARTYAALRPRAAGGFAADHLRAGPGTTSARADHAAHQHRRRCAPAELGRLGIQDLMTRGCKGVREAPARLAALSIRGTSFKAFYRGRRGDHVRRDVDLGAALRQAGARDGGEGNRTPQRKAELARSPKPANGRRRTRADVPRGAPGAVVRQLFSRSSRWSGGQICQGRYDPDLPVLP